MRPDPPPVGGAPGYGGVWTFCALWASYVTRKDPLLKQDVMQLFDDFAAKYAFTTPELERLMVEEEAVCADWAKALERAKPWQRGEVSTRYRWLLAEARDLKRDEFGAVKGGILNDSTDSTVIVPRNHRWMIVPAPYVVGAEYHHHPTSGRVPPPVRSNAAGRTPA